MRTAMPNSSMSRVGNIRKKLKTTSNRHINTPNMLGTCMFPSQRSMPAARM